MANTIELKQQIAQGEYDAAFAKLYGADAVQEQRKRYTDLIDEFEKKYGTNRTVRLYSAPGRTEIGGNHTDHQHGRVLAAAVTLDKLAIVSPQKEGPVEIGSKSHPLPPLDWRDLTHYEKERGHSPSMIRGVFAGLRQQGYAAGGFAGVTDSVVPTGSGLSSSAAFELLLGQIQNALYNDGAIPPVALARIGQYAENEYFGKPCGLMDQTASAVGSAVAIDFLCPKAPIVERLPCDFARWGMTMYVVNTGGSHADLTEDYTAIPREMRAVAAQFGCRVLREVDPAEFYAGLPGLRGKVSDRAILRAMHFFEENERVPRLAAALREPTAEHYLEEMLASGESSMEKLQNIYPADPNERGLALALSLCRRELTGCGGWRVHGGGFAGTIQALVPREREAGFLWVMRETFGEESCTHLTARAVGACELEFPE